VSGSSLYDPQRRQPAMRSTAARRRKDQAFLWFCVLTASLSVLVLIVLLGAILVQGTSHLIRDPVERLAEFEERDAAGAAADRGASQQPPTDAESPRAIYDRLDDNGDGRLIEREVPRDIRPQIERLVRLYDADGDEALDPAEFAAAADASTLTWFRRNAIQFVTSSPDPEPSEAGVYPALWGTVYVCLVCALFTLPIGVGTAIFLEEFQPHRRWAKRFHSFVQLNIGNLAGVPSVVYGIIGVTAFVNMLGEFGNLRSPAFEFGVEHFDQFLTEGDRVLLVPVESGNSPSSVAQPGMTAFTPGGEPVQVHVIGSGEPLPDDPDLLGRTLRQGDEGGRISEEAWYYLRLPLGDSVLAGGLTLMLVVLPIVIIASQEALRAVPSSLRDGAFGLGATRWQTIRRVTLPAAVPGIMTGSIISTSRAIGEAAPILIISGVVYISSAPQHLMDKFAVLPLQIFHWAGLAQKTFHELAASGIIVLLAVLLTFNAVAVLIRHRMQKPLS
jgi:phosphate transport system permease protein